MFYDRYILLCERKGKKPYEVARELGFGNSNVAQWKKGSTPRRDSVALIADYFGVTVGYLVTGESGQKNSPATQEGSGDEVTQELYSIIKNATPEERQEIINFANYIKSKRNEG